MSLENIKIIGYRGFKELGSLDFAIPNGTEGSGLTIITGPNNSGKSSILECLRTRNGYQGVSFTEGTINSSIQSVKVKFTINSNEEIVESITRGSSETKKSNLDPNFQIFVLPSRRAFHPYFSKNSQSREDYLNNTHLPLQRESTLTNFESRLFKILESPEEFNEILYEVLGFQVDWTIALSEHGQYFLKFIDEEHSHSSQGVGEGIISLFSIVDALYDSTVGNVVVIDEPELSLHPSLQKRLNKVFLRFSKDRQIVISTHSPYFVDVTALKCGAHLARITTGETGTKIHQLSDKGKSIITALAKDNLYNPHVFGLDARELFFLEDGVILTEGQEDVLLLPLIFEIFKKPIPGNFFGWGAGGASNIIKICQILKDLGFIRVLGVFDNDKEDEKNQCDKEFPEYSFLCLPAADIRDKKPQSAKKEVEGLLYKDKKTKTFLIKDDLKDDALSFVTSLIEKMEIK